MNNAASNQFFLYLHENFTRDDGFMAIFHIVLRDKAVILNALLCKKVNSSVLSSQYIEPNLEA